MRRFFILLLLFIQSFFLFANAGEINLQAQSLNNQTSYIQAQTQQKKVFYIDFKNYENAIIAISTKTEELLAYKDNQNINNFAVGFWTDSISNNNSHLIAKSKYVFTKTHDIFSNLKNEIHTRAP